MNYAVVTLTIKDGEYEYMAQSPIMGNESIEELSKAYARHYLGGTEDGSKEQEDGSFEEECGYRIVEIDKVVKVTKKEYDVLTKYIY